ncbi:MAG: nitroreductase family protein [Acidimicrobiia bacterium]|nr:nitroreductase family protein [Acidimicrobiia bacterium]MDH4307788.1 nitroreductase family protein [Acidimicrobiia bacterium]
MEFSETLARRRMVRNYLELPVAREVVDRIVSAGLRAPSAGFSQGQRFVVVTDAGPRKAIADLAGESDYVAAGFEPWISRAPVHIVVAVSEADYHRRYSEPDKLRPDGTEIDWPVPYWWVDAGASMMAILLAAVDEGLGAGFLGVHSIPGLRSLLDIPTDVSPIGVITVGHPAPDRRSGSLARGWRPHRETIHWNRWSDPGTEAPTDDR